MPTVASNSGRLLTAKVFHATVIQPSLKSTNLTLVSAAIDEFGEVLFITQRLSGDYSFHAIGDCINISARLQSSVPPNHLAISNVIKTRIFKDDYGFEDISPLDLKNIGRIKAWKKSYK